MVNQRKIGSYYEQIAGSYLEKQGYNILMYNFNCRTGEIDIIAKDKETLVFCEVKYRSSNQYGDPFHAVDLKKQRTLSKCALYYMTTHKCLECDCRFDVIGITNDGIKIVKDAFFYIE